MKKYLPALLALVVGLAAGWAINNLWDNPPAIKNVKVISHDTIFQVISHPPIIAKLKSKIIKIDSSSEAKPVHNFTAHADSLISGDTISLSFAYPANTFDLAIRRRADTVLKTEINILESGNQAGSSVWETILYVVTGLLCGSLITLAVGG